MSDAELAGRICLVTGATSGIGEATAVGLAQRGAHVALIGRSRERAEASVATVKAKSGNPNVEFLLGAQRILAAFPQIHVLVNNAGVVNLARETTADGLETTFAVNHLAYFLLTRMLEERLVASAPARVVNVASGAHRFANLDLDDLQWERKKYTWMRVYGTSKLANILFSNELARRLAGAGVTVNCLHPGGVGTRLGSNNGGISRILNPIARPFLRTPERGAETSIYLAASDDVADVTGGYFANCRQKSPSAAARDEALAGRLWEASERLTGLAD